MANEKTVKTSEQAIAREALRRKLGFAWRRRIGGQVPSSWQQTVTHFKPEPWLEAVAHDEARMPVKLRDLPEANR